MQSVRPARLREAPLRPASPVTLTGALVEQELAISCALGIRCGLNRRGVAFHRRLPKEQQVKPDVSVSAFLKMARKGELVIEKSKCRVSKIESRTRSLLATLDSRRTAAAHGRQGR